MEKLTNLVKELLEKGVWIEGVSLKGDSLGYTINGFAKSGNGTLYIEDGVIKLQTRYDTIDTIEDLRDIASVAYRWDSGYCKKNGIYTVYGVSGPWRKIYETYGWDTSDLR